MRDQRLRVFRTAVDGLVESLDAFVRLSRWTEGESKPEPLVAAAAKLFERLGAADRLAASQFQGPPADTAKVTAMCSALKRLDAAYLAYCKQGASATHRAEAMTALETEIAATAELALRWN
jgi:protein tyrosine phosphatase (PTP) superfamily phosphohydrolase (DUF442 family)